MADFWLYPRNERTPMNFVLDEVERLIGPRFSIYWVDQGSPELFTLPGFSPSPVVFSPCYLSLSSLMRTLLLDDKLGGDTLIKIAEQSLLKIMAEIALRRGNPDYAVVAFVKSTTPARIILGLFDCNDASKVLDLEGGPIDEAYMTIWFYGLVHELGHLYPDQIQHFSDASILELISTALNESSSFPDFLKPEIIERAKQQQMNSLLGIDQIRSEVQADIFAATVLFQTTFNIMREINRKSFEVARFIEEMLIFLNIVAVIDRCRRVASIASGTTMAPEALKEMILHPISMRIRVEILLDYLKFVAIDYLFDTNNPTPEQSQQVEDLINQIIKHYEQRFNLLSSSIVSVMEFSLFPERRESEWELLEAFRKSLLDTSGIAANVEGRRFCELAAALKVDSKLLRVLKSIIDSPSHPISFDLKRALIYSIPWIEGSNGFNRPLVLSTKYGLLIIAFHKQNELYTAFFKESTKALKPGLTLKNAIIAVSSEKQLESMLETHMLEGECFQVIVEGTKEFEQYMKELAYGTIWKDDQ